MKARRAKRVVAKKLHVDTRRKHAGAQPRTSRGFTADPQAVRNAKAMERK